MLGMTDVHDLPLRTAVDHYLVALRVEGAAPTTIATYRSVLASYLRWATTDAASTLADFTLLQVRGYVAHLMDEHVRFAHHHNVRAGGRLSDYTINLHGRVLRTFAALAGAGGVHGGARAGPVQAAAPADEAHRAPDPGGVPGDGGRPRGAGQPAGARTRGVVPPLRHRHPGVGAGRHSAGRPGSGRRGSCGCAARAANASGSSGAPSAWACARSGRCSSTPSATGRPRSRWARSGCS